MNIIQLKSAPSISEVLKLLTPTPKNSITTITLCDGSEHDILVTGFVKQDEFSISYTIKGKLDINSLGADALVNYLFTHNDSTACCENANVEIFVSTKRKEVFLYIP